MMPVRSSNLRAVDYSPLTQTLTIQFHGGRVYEYYGVPQSIFDGLLAAESKGRFHHIHIRYSYRYRRIR